MNVPHITVQSIGLMRIEKNFQRPSELTHKYALPTRVFVKLKLELVSVDGKFINRQFDVDGRIRQRRTRVN